MLPVVIAGGIVALVESAFRGDPPSEVASAVEAVESSKPEVDSVDYVIGVLAAEKNKLTGENSDSTQPERTAIPEIEAYDLAINKLIQYKDQITSEIGSEDDESEDA